MLFPRNLQAREKQRLQNRKLRGVEDKEDRVDSEFWKKIVELKKHGNERRRCKEAEDGQ